MNPLARHLPSAVPSRGPSATMPSRRWASLSLAPRGSRALSILLGAVLLPALRLPSQAASLTIVNPSFEIPGGFAAGAFAVGAPPNYPFSAPGFGWSAFGVDGDFRSSGVVNPNSTTLYGSPVPDGSNVGVLFLWDNPGDQSVFAGVPAGLTQTLSAVLEASTQYTLTVSVGNIANDVTAPHNQFQFTGFPGYSVNLLAGGVVVASDVNTQAPAEGGFATSTVQLSVGDAHAQLGQALGIQLINLNANTGLEVNFDQVGLSASAIPEPEDWALLSAIALGGFALARRRNHPKPRNRGFLPCAQCVPWSPKPFHSALPGVRGNPLPDASPPRNCHLEHGLNPDPDRFLQPLRRFHRLQPHPDMKTQHPDPRHTQPSRPSRNSCPATRASALGIAAAVGLASLCHPAHAQIVFTDAEFADTDWTSSKFQDTTPGGAATVSFQRQVVGGNPGAYQQVTLGLNDGNIFSVHLRGGISYNPATLGAVTGLHWAADLRGDPDEVGANFGIGPLIRQGGLYYANLGHSVSGAAWQSFTDNDLQGGGLFLLAGQVGPALPDFTVAGGTLEFGFYVIKSVDNSGPYSLKAGIDDWRVEVSSVPEPEGWALLSALGLGGFALARRRNHPME